jgi:hypothetical protein
VAFEDFDRRESSQADGSPIRLYLLEWGNTRWRYTSADQPISRYEDVPDEDGILQRELVTYAPVPCNDEGMTQGGSSNNAFTLKVPGNLPVVELFRSTPPTESIWLTVRTVHKPHDEVPPLPQVAEPHTHWRFRFSGSFSDVVAARQVQFRETADGPNLAVGGTPLSGGWYYGPDNPAYGPADAFDGADWSAFASKTNFPNEWIGYQFDDPVAINHFAHWTRQYYPEQSPKGGWLEYSDDGVTWTTLYQAAPRKRADIREDMPWTSSRPPSALEADAPIYWIGTVGNIKRPDPAEATILGRPITATFKRVGLRLCWTRGCPHALYDDECKVDPEDHRVTGTVFMAGGAQVVIETDTPISNVAAFIGGIFDWEADPATGTRDSRTIENASGSGTTITLTIFGTADRVTDGAACSILPGCDLTPETCQARFNNLVNYGGFKQMAGKSPFDGSPVF